MSCHFPKSLRVVKRSHFKWLSYHSKRLLGNYLVIDIKKNSLDFSRLGITVTKKSGKSHERNRFKRLIREAYRCHRTLLIAGYDMNVRPRSPLPGVTLSQIISELLSLVGAHDDKTTSPGSTGS